MVAPIDERHVDRRRFQRARRPKSAESPADDQDLFPHVTTPLRFGDRLELREIRPPLVEKGVERLLRLRRTHTRGEFLHLEPARLVEMLADCTLQQLLARRERVDRLFGELFAACVAVSSTAWSGTTAVTSPTARAPGAKRRSKQEHLGGPPPTTRAEARSSIPSRERGQIDERRDEPGALARIDEIAMDEHRGSEPPQPRAPPRRSACRSHSARRTSASAGFSPGRAGSSRNPRDRCRR